MDLTGAQWRTSSYSGSNGGTCVEVAALARAGAASVVAVRDSTDPDGPALAFPPEQWQAFTRRVKAGAFDLA